MKLFFYFWVPLLIVTVLVCHYQAAQSRELQEKLEASEAELEAQWKRLGWEPQPLTDAERQLKATKETNRLLKELQKNKKTPIPGIFH